MEDHILNAPCAVCGKMDLIVWYKREINGYACTDCAEKLEHPPEFKEDLFPDLPPKDPEVTGEIEDYSSEDASREHAALHSPGAAVGGPPPSEENLPIETLEESPAAYSGESFFSRLSGKDKFAIVLGVPWVIAGLFVVIWMALFPWDLGIGIGPGIGIVLGLFLNYRFAVAFFGKKKG